MSNPWARLAFLQPTDMHVIKNPTLLFGQTTRRESLKYIVMIGKGQKRQRLIERDNVG